MDTVVLTFFGDTYFADLEVDENIGVLDEINVLFEKSDYRILNVESALGTASDYSPIKKTGPNLIMEENWLDVFSRVKIDVLVLSNNHTNDYGCSCLEKMLQNIRKRGILPVGAGKNIIEAYKPVRFEKSKNKISILSICENEFGVASNNTPGVAGYSRKRVHDVIKAEILEGYGVIVVFHGGTELYAFPSPYVRERYREIIDDGAIAVIAMHTHCPQGYEIYNDAPIIYSLGNLVFHNKEKRLPTDIWNRGYAVQLAVDDQKAYIREICPYTYDFDNRRVRFLESDERMVFLNYLNRISEDIQDSDILSKHYREWCYKNSDYYTSIIEGKTVLDQTSFGLEIQNLFRCESHRERMFTYYEIEAGTIAPSCQEDYSQYGIIPFSNRYLTWFYGDIDDYAEKIVSHNRNMCDWLSAKDILGEMLNDEKMTDKEVLIYGTGVVATLVFLYFCLTGARERVKAFVETKKEKKTFYGCPVISVDELVYSDTEIVLISTLRNTRTQIVQECIEKQVSNYIEVFAFDKRDYTYYKELDEKYYAAEIVGWYRRTVGKDLNLNNPVSFNEKVQWIKVNDRNPIKTRCADKFLVRDYIKEKVGDKYLTKIYGVWENALDIDFDSLPNKYVLKCNHGCGWNIIVRNNDCLDYAVTREKINDWLNTNFAFVSGLELQYLNIEPLVFAEEYLCNANDDLYDYKFWCYDGHVAFILFLSEREKGLKMDVFDTNWNLLPFTYTYYNSGKKIEKPSNLDEMLTIAEKLSEGFSHVRIDLYRLNDGTLKFGEMTFTSASGTGKFYPPEYDLYLGEMWNIGNC